MNITGHKLHLVRVPYDGPRTGTHLVLQLQTDAGLTGCGYVSFAGEGAWTAKPLAATCEALLDLIERVDLLDAEACSGALLGTPGLMSGIRHRAASMIDVALWDIRGKALGQPVYRLLGGARNRVRVYGGWKLWWQLDLDTVTENAAWFAAEGFTAIKFRLGGVPETAKAVERVKLIREAAGEQMDLLVDMNQSWSVKQTLRVAPELERFRLFYIEDPVSHDDHDGLTRVAQALATPIAAGEAYHSSLPFRQLLEKNGLDIVMADLNVGGLTPWMKIAHLAESFGKPIVSHLCPEILAHALAAAPNGVILEYLPWASLLWKEPPAIKEGQFMLGDRPGLGLELDESALQRYAFAG